MFLFILFLLAACAQKIAFSRDRLPNTIIGKPLYGELKITAGATKVRLISGVVKPPILIVACTHKSDLVDCIFNIELALKKLTLSE
ncbi:MAG: hypothetical protein J6578_02160 [Snodgrassella sp.]|uniref:hypothetical protein n=1 Tax=Snodgrassella sp. TaxID=2815304 RepID=UPI0025841C59|nr:hypothetical protein [Snodgrassella sp.]MCO6507587.1 hypothetical protein [Snodgrassella sp.]